METSSPQILKLCVFYLGAPFIRGSIILYICYILRSKGNEGELVRCLFDLSLNSVVSVSDSLRQVGGLLPQTTFLQVHLQLHPTLQLLHLLLWSPW